MENRNRNEVCCCCHTPGQFKSFTTPYMVKKNEEIYSIMLRETFGIEFQELELSKHICDVCIYRLRQAKQFKTQILACEDVLNTYILDKCKPTIKEEDLNNEEKSITFKEEILLEFEEAQHNSDSDDAYIGKNQNTTTTVIAKKKFNNESVLKSKSIKSNKKKTNWMTSIREMAFEKNTFSYVAKLDSGYACRNCPLKFESLHAIKTHVVKKHIMRHACKYCLNIFETISEYKKHLNTMHQLTCDICSTICPSRKMLILHMRKHMGIAMKNRVCHFCGHRFYDIVNMNKHIDAVHKLIKYDCPYCPRKFGSRYLQSHIKKHKGIFPYNCDDCSKKFIDKTDYIKHIRTHNKSQSDDTPNTSEKIMLNTETFKCTDCCRDFRNKRSFAAHMKKSGHGAYSDSEFKHVCAICGKRYMSKYTLRQHTIAHNGEKLFSCNICNKKFKTKLSAARHTTNLHTNKKTVRQFKCNQCNIWVRDLEEHKKVHLIRPFKCHICPKTYPHISALNKHLDIHDGVRYACDLCPKIFKHKIGLKKHTQRFHSVK